LEISKWACDYQRFPDAAQRLLGDPALVLPGLTDLCQTRINGDAFLRARIRDRGQTVAAMHDRQRAKWRDQAREGWDSQPITLPRLASEVWAKIRHEDWVLTTNPFEDWATKL